MSRTTNYHLREAIRQLTDIHDVFINQFARALGLLHTELEAQEVSPWQAAIEVRQQSIPVLDHSTWTVLYCGRECFLGNTKSFFLLKRLLRRPNQDVSHAQLLSDVWECKVSSDAVRAAMKILRKRLRNGGMTDVACAIVGRTAGHYAFLVSRL